MTQHYSRQATTSIRLSLCATAIIGALAGCSDKSTEPTNAACPAATSSVQATVSVGSSVVFDWNPKCGVALLLVELDGSDQWGLATPNLENNPTESDNIILPPVTYGVVPPGAQEDPSPTTLVSGQSYNLVLWKVVPAGSTIQCQQRFEDACLLAVKSFQR